MEIHSIDLHFQGKVHEIATYLVVGPQGPVLVEPGPCSTLAALHTGLAQYGYKSSDIRHILVTHIHLDHAGSAGWWAQQGSRTHVHQRGARHLIDPTKLIASAKRIYQDRMDALWGEILPAPAEQVTALADVDTVQVGGLTFTALDTPGHANHHHSFRLDDVVFTGDAAGMRLPGSPFISLPTPPPEFNLEAWHQTLIRLLEEKFTTLYLTHFGPIMDVQPHLEMLTSLLDQSAEFVRERMQNDVDRDKIMQEYQAWDRNRAAAKGVSEQVYEQYEIAGSTSMSVDGLMRYWRKRWEKDAEMQSQ